MEAGFARPVFALARRLEAFFAPEGFEAWLFPWAGRRFGVGRDGELGVEPLRGCWLSLPWRASSSRRRRCLSIQSLSASAS